MPAVKQGVFTNSKEMEEKAVKINQLSVPFFEITGSDLNVVAGQLSKAAKYSLEFAPWQQAFPYKPDVQFAMAYNATSILLQFDVTESVVQAANGIINQPVYQDSCVEFFISLDDDGTYYNFEFNCLGTVLAGHGSGRSDRVLLPETVLNQLSSQSAIRRISGQGSVNWQLTVAIPFSAFLYHSGSSLRGRQCKANFYKCGDLLPEPHFLCWSEIQSSEPNFHLPQYFGTLLFE